MARRHSPSKTATSKKLPRQPPDRQGGRHGCNQPAGQTLAGRRLAPWEWLLLAALVGAVLLVYQPAWHGGFIWDDDAHVTRPELRSWQGLYRIWFELAATQQYYPLLHSAFWVEHKLWGDAVLGYHLVNILLHAAAAVMVALVLRRLAVPGAYLAAAIFALHPVQVESVAWITELKNTLSAVFYLGAMLVYLRFDQTRHRSWYACAMGLFVLGLLSKTVTATLPAALLVVFWWQRGRLSWRRDVVPLIPLFLLGVAAGQLTAWFERMMIELGGVQVRLTMVERCLVAGRAICFYLAKLFWPTNLIFLYPRWNVDQNVWWQYLFPAGVVLLSIAAWKLRRRWRGPLAGLLLFVGTLFPALGFHDLFPFLYSFVADHFQYLASLGVITLASAGAALLIERCGRWGRAGGYALCLTLLAVLGALSWRQSQMYVDVETLYRTTIDRNPQCWLACYNLGVALVGRGRFDEATAWFRRAVEIRPQYAEAHRNLGLALRMCGKTDEAIGHLQRAVAIRPDDAPARKSLGKALASRGRYEEAAVQYRQALRTNPADAELYYFLGSVLRAQGQTGPAIAQYQQALEIRPDYIDAYDGLGGLFADRGEFKEAIRCYRKSLRLRPDQPHILNNLAWLLATCPLAAVRDGAEATAHAQRAKQLWGDVPEVLDTLAAAYAEAGRFPDALATARRALELAQRQNNRASVDALKGRIALYEVGKPYCLAPPK